MAYQDPRYVVITGGNANPTNFGTSNAQILFGNVIGIQNLAATSGNVLTLVAGNLSAANINMTGTTITSGTLSITNTTDAVSPSTGALKVSGGIGILGNVHIGGNLYVLGNTVTLSTTTNGGYIQGPGQGATATTYGLIAGGLCTVFSDGTNYQVVSVNGANTVVNTLTANSTVSLSPASANVTISPTGSGNFVVNPAGTLANNTIDNVTIGATTPGTGKFTTLTLNTTMDGTGTIDGGTY
jgi:hypothetical protein